MLEERFWLELASSIRYHSIDKPLINKTSSMAYMMERSLLVFDSFYEMLIMEELYEFCD